MQKVCVVIPNWNGADDLPSCLDSLQGQSLDSYIIVVDNGSQDSSVDLINKKYPDVEVITLPKNIGFAGGVNVGIRRSIELESKYVALFNNDAVADKDWLKNLVGFLEKHSLAGTVTSKIMDSQKQYLDSTGDFYTSWGLAFPRGRREPVSDKYDKDVWVFGASGGASLYRVKMLQEIGLFDEDFFAYYEDVDVSFRAQLAGWKVGYEPKAIVYHSIGTTSSRIKGFTTYQTIKNYPWLFWKNVPWQLVPTILPRFSLSYLSFMASSVARGQIGPVLKGLLYSSLLLPKKLWQRQQVKRAVPVDYIRSIIIHDLPPNARKLRALRKRWWKIAGKASV